MCRCDDEEEDNLASYLKDAVIRSWREEERIRGKLTPERKAWLATTTVRHELQSMNDEPGSPPPQVPYPI